jgi:NAD(P)H-nitrite reductase large subunit
MVPTTQGEVRPQLRIERCICHDVTFRQVVEWSRATGCTSVDGAARELKCTTSCGMCMPYVERALETGQAVFHEILPARDRTARK